MTITRLRNTLFCSALLLATTIAPGSLSAKPAAGAKPHANRQEQVRSIMPRNTKTRCADIGPVSRCCTDTGFCCVWAGGGSPTCG